MSAYRDRVRIYRPAGGSQDADGVFSPGEPLELYDGPADLQPGGRVIRRSQEDGRPIEFSDAELFFPRRSGTSVMLLPGDVVVVQTVDGRERKAKVAELSDLDNTASLQWL